MRPQHITAENDRYAADPAACDVASMRPQHITAENIWGTSSIWSVISCFNEAAAYHCGKPARHPVTQIVAALLQ